MQSYTHTLKVNDVVTTEKGVILFVVTALIPGIAIAQIRVVNLSETMLVDSETLVYIGHLPNGND